MSKSQFYVNSDIKYLINKDIRELDIQRAGLRALKNMGAITDETYDYWKSRDKRWSSVYIGKHLSSRMKEQNAMITSAVDKFVVENKINESNIISRKRDALFTFNIRPTVMEIDGYQFVTKHQYTSYYYLGKHGSNKFEMYYNRKTDKLIILGVSKVYYENHPLIPYIKSCIKWYEMLDSGLTTYKEVYSKVHQLRNDYCGFKLPLGCYRELAYENPYCLYDTTTGMCSYHAQLPELDKDRYTLMINYNFTHFIVPFINILPSLKNKEIKRYDSRTWRQNPHHG